MKGLRRDHHGDVPAWSLQSVVNSYRIAVTEVQGKQQQPPPQEPQPQPKPQQPLPQQQPQPPQPQPQQQQRQRCQIRAYVVVCEMGNRISCFQYNDLEVRVPFWDIDLDETLSSSGITPSAAKPTPTTTIPPTTLPPPPPSSTTAAAAASTSITATNSNLRRMFTTGETLSVAGRHHTIPNQTRLG